MCNKEEKEFFLLNVHFIPTFSKSLVTSLQQCKHLNRTESKEESKKNHHQSISLAPVQIKKNNKNSKQRTGNVNVSLNHLFNLKAKKKKKKIVA